MGLIAAVAMFAMLFVVMSVNQRRTTEEAVKEATERIAAENVELAAVAAQDVEMVVASQDIPKGTVVTLEMMKVITLSRENAASVIALTVPQMAVGRVAKRDIMEDQPIMNAYLAEIGEEDANPKSLSYSIPAGMYAIPISTDILNGVAGYLTEGDIVDIIADKKTVDSAIGKTAADAILADEVNNISETDDHKSYLVSNVPVIATTVYQGNPAASGIEEGSAEVGDPNAAPAAAPASDYLILALTKEAAKMVAEARGQSELTLILHRREDEDILNSDVPNEFYSLIGDGTLVEEENITEEMMEGVLTEGVIEEMVY